jgi:retinol dehydrogenase-13
MKTCLITGANSGIGKSAAKQITQKGYRVLLACHSLNKGFAAKKELCQGNAKPRNKTVSGKFVLM